MAGDQEINNCVPENSQIKEYLDFYLCQEAAPKYAVLIGGPWGVGKTHFLNRYLLEVHEKKSIEDSAKDLKCFQYTPLKNDDHIYVSLNGIEKVEEIDWAIAQERFPVKISKRGRAISRISAGFAKVFVPSLENLNGLKIDDLFNGVTERLLIFDDFERCDIKEQLLLGYINFLVEHADCWVIILANEEKLHKKFKKLKEKVIGHSMTLRSEFHGPFISFVNNRIERKHRDFVCSLTEEFQAAFENSKTNNLRILDQTIMLFSQILPALEPRRENKEFISRFLPIFLGLSFDSRAGRLNKGDIAFASLVAGFGSKQKKKSKLQRMTNRYGVNFLIDQILTDKTWDKIIFDGLIDVREVDEQFSQSRYLLKPEDQPSWRVVWYYKYMNKKDVAAAIETMESEFRNRK